VVFAISVGTHAIVGEEERGTMDVLLAQPVSRSSVVLQSFAALAVLVSVLALGLTVVLAATSPMFDLNLSMEGIVAANVGVALLALVFGALALAVGGLTGNRPLTLGVVTGVVVAGYFVNGLASVVEALEPFRLFSPFHWFLAPNPLGEGLDWGSLGLMAAVSLAFAAAAALAFDRRDIAS
jgi:ABC-2 type transport system permease protein